MIGWTKLGGSPGCSSSASIRASTASAAASAIDAGDLCGVRQGRIGAEDRQRPRHGGDRRRAALQPAAHEAGHRRGSRAGDRAGVDAHAVLERGDELSREQRVPGGRPSASAHTASAVVLAQAAAHELGDGGRT